MRKLSEIIIEIAKVGFNDEKYYHSELMHTLMFLAHVAWNRDTKDPEYLAGDLLLKNLKKFPFNKTKVRKQLISEDREELIAKMLAYKRKHFADDKRKITLCAYTPWETLRIEWEL